MRHAGYWNKGQNDDRLGGVLDKDAVKRTMDEIRKHGLNLPVCRLTRNWHG